MTAKISQLLDISNGPTDGDAPGANAQYRYIIVYKIRF